MQHVQLSEVADIDNLLGFKGNYMLFPLFESNPLTDYMMEPYVDRATGELLDPAGHSLDRFVKYVECIKEELTDEEFEAPAPAPQGAVRGAAGCTATDR